MSRPGETKRAAGGPADNRPPGGGAMEGGPVEADPADDPRLNPVRPREIALVLPFLGLALFSPPLITLFASDAPVFGAPFIVAYLFAVWAALIGLAFVLSRRLGAANAEEDPS